MGTGNSRCPRGTASCPRSRIPACPLVLSVGEALTHQEAELQCPRRGPSARSPPGRLCNGEEEGADHRKGHPVTRRKGGKMGVPDKTGSCAVQPICRGRWQARYKGAWFCPTARRSVRRSVHYNPLPPCKGELFTTHPARGLEPGVVSGRIPAELWESQR